jgi:PAS domain S-box-containing protein
MSDTSHFFEAIYANSKQNAILVMGKDGTIQQVNDAFTMAYGYTTEDLREKHFRVLYLEKDQVTRRPEIELNIVFREGSSSDENYLVHKDGTPIWVTGESVLVKEEESQVRIVKIIHNIHAQKQLERYLMASSELLDSLFESVKSGLLVLDTRMRAVKANKAFKTMFGIGEPIKEGTRLQELTHPFWSGEEIKNDIRNAIVNATSVNKEYIIDDGDNKFRRIQVTSKLIISEELGDKKLLLVMKDQ